VHRDERVRVRSLLNQPCYHRRLSSCYHYIVLRSVPAGCRRALDVGCGTGLLTERLASRSERVIGIDLDRDALSLARSSPEHESRVQFIAGDAMNHPFLPTTFDFITAVAALHHLPLRPALASLRDLVKPGGTIAIIGFYKSQTVGDYVLDALARPIRRVVYAVRDCSPPPKFKGGQRETLAEIRSACDTLLPGAVVRRLFLFGYSLIWHKRREDV
jgi:SAM-dependent methyltransferase